MLWRRFGSFLALASVVGCSEVVVDPSDGGGGGSTSSSASLAGSTSGSGSPSSSGSTSATSSSSGSGGCPDITCELDCPSGLWNDMDGCPTCTCAPPEKQLWVQGIQRDPAHLTITTVATKYIGGIDRWVFDFTWHYDDPLASDDEEFVTAQVRVQDLPMYEITEANVSWFSPSDDGTPLELMEGTYTLYGFGVVTDTLTPAAGFLSIRRDGNTFEGGVFLFMNGAGPAGAVDAGGPFSVAVP